MKTLLTLVLLIGAGILASPARACTISVNGGDGNQYNASNGINHHCTWVLIEKAEEETPGQYCCSHTCAKWKKSYWTGFGWVRISGAIVGCYSGSQG